MSSLKESQKSARVRILADGLSFLCSQYGDGGYTVRSQIFYVHNKYKSSERDETFKKDWQRTALKRLIDDGILEETKTDGNQITYRIANGQIAKANSILENYNDGDGSLITQYLWPKKKPSTDIVSTSNDPEDDAIDAVVSNEDDSELKKLADAMSKMVEILSDNQTVFISRLDEYSEKVTGLQNDLKMAILEISGKMGANNGEIIKKLGGNNKRLEELGNTVVGMRRVVESNQSTMKNALKSIETINSTSDEMKIAAKAMREAEVGARSLHQAVEVLVGKFNEEKKDKVGSLLKAIEKHVNDGEQLRDIVLEQISEMNDGQSTEA